MSDEEIVQFIERSRTATMATVLPDGRPHLVAMWYAVVDGEIWFETKAKSQKAVNLRRDPTITVMIEDGQSYDTLRGVSIDGKAEIVDDPENILRVGKSVWERYTGPKGKIVGMRTFGASAPLKDLLRKFGFTVENVVAVAKQSLGK